MLTNTLSSFALAEISISSPICSVTSFRNTRAEWSLTADRSAVSAAGTTSGAADFLGSGSGFFSGLSIFSFFCAFTGSGFVLTFSFTSSAFTFSTGFFFSTLTKANFDPIPKNPLDGSSRTVTSTSSIVNFSSANARFTAVSTSVPHFSETSIFIFSSNSSYFFFFFAGLSFAFRAFLI